MYESVGDRSAPRLVENPIPLSFTRVASKITDVAHERNFLQELKEGTSQSDPYSDCDETRIQV